MQQESTALFDLQLDQEGTSYLAQAAKWGRFISIVGFIMVAFLFIFSFFATAFLASLPGFSSTDPSSSMLGGAVTFFYILLSVLWLMPVLYLYRFSTKLLAALRTHDQPLINQAFRNLKSCFKFMGIMTIIVLSIYALVIVFVIGAAVIGVAGR